MCTNVFSCIRNDPFAKNKQQKKSFYFSGIFANVVCKSPYAIRALKALERNRSWLVSSLLWCKSFCHEIKESASNFTFGSLFNFVE
jgi:hypothetical protein